MKLEAESDGNRAHGFWVDNISRFCFLSSGTSHLRKTCVASCEQFIWVSLK